MNPLISGKLRLLGEFCGFGAVAGVIFQMLHDGRVDHMGPLIGVSLGGAFGIIELFMLAGFSKQFLKIPLLLTIFIKAIVYLIIINLVSGFWSLSVGAIQGMEMQEFYDSMLSKYQLIFNVYTIVLFMFLSFYMQVNQLLGKSVLLNFLLGKYRKPIGEHRIFMFLDLKSSTTLAEKLGLEKYYSLLNDFFHEISEPALITNAEIYQYVGDEVVFTWKTKDGITNANCLRIFFKIREKVYNNRKHYRDKYGDLPQFKAGIHVGEVISAQIGDIKREIVYNGDVMNTSARIQEQCKIFDRDLLISGSLLNQLDIENEYRAEQIETVKLRGKEQPVELFSLVEY